MNGGSASTGIAMEKLVGNNYNYWKLCMEAYLQGQDLWDLIEGDDTEIPADTPQNAELRRKWKIKCGKALFTLRTLISKEYIDHVRDLKSPKQVWETLQKLFTKKNTARLQFLENELAMVTQGNLSIEEYFLKVKNLCSEISELDAEEPVSDARLRRYLIRGLRKDFMPFVSSIQGWANQPTVIELENLLSNQEALIKQMISNYEPSPKSEDVLYVKDQRRQNFHSKPSSSNRNQFRSVESSKKPFKVCYRCGKPGHFKRDCRVKVVCDRCGKPGHIKPNCRVKMQESEVNAVHESKNSSDPIWEHCLTIEVLDQPTNVTSAVHQDDVSSDAHAFIDYNEEWIVDSGCSHHATRNETLLSDVRPHCQRKVVETAELLCRRDQAAHLSALTEAKRREDSLKKAIGIKEECISSLEKALHEMRLESAETKVAAESRLTEARIMMEDAEKKFIEAEAKLHAAEFLQAEANRCNRAADRKLQEVEAREDDLRRRMECFKSDCDKKGEEIVLERQSLSERQKALQQEYERLLDGQALLNQREEYILSKSQELHRLEKELEESRANIENERKAIHDEKSKLQLTEVSLSKREEAVNRMEILLNRREQELLILQEKITTKESNEIQKVVANHESTLRTKISDFDAELQVKQKAVEDEIEGKRRAWELRELDLKQWGEQLLVFLLSIWSVVHPMRILFMISIELARSRPAASEMLKHKFIEK